MVKTGVAHSHVNVSVTKGDIKTLRQYLRVLGDIMTFVGQYLGYIKTLMRHYLRVMQENGRQRDDFERICL